MPDAPSIQDRLPKEAKLSVIVRNRERIFYDGKAKAVTSYNAKGKFDILEEHVNFISIITTGITIYKEDNTTQEFKISTGVLKVSKNSIEIFLGILTQNPTVNPKSPFPTAQS